MGVIIKTLTWGSLIGIIHFIIIGVLYQNPFVAKMYKKQSSHPGVKKWDSTFKYILFMFLGTQLEVYIISMGFIFLITLLGKSVINTLILALIISGIRIYPRFWNMWIQSSYPNRLLLIELINGTIGSFLIAFGLYVLPI